MTWEEEGRGGRGVQVEGEAASKRQKFAFKDYILGVFLTVLRPKF